MGMKVISKFFAVFLDSDTKSVHFCAAVWARLQGKFLRGKFHQNSTFGALNVLMDVFQLTFPPSQLWGGRFSHPSAVASVTGFNLCKPTLTESSSLDRHLKGMYIYMTRPTFQTVFFFFFNFLLKRLRYRLTLFCKWLFYFSWNRTYTHSDKTEWKVAIHGSSCTKLWSC